MKYTFLSALIIATFFISTATAKPHAVTIYPNGATLTAQTTLTDEKSEINLLLPNVAVPESITIALQPQQGQKITAVSYESILVEDAVHKELKELIDQLEDKITKIDDQLKSLEMTLNFWNKQLELPNKGVSATIEMGKVIRAESSTLLQSNSNLQSEKGKLTQQLNEAREKLQKKTGHNQRNWMVTINLAQPTQKGEKLSYTYRVHQAGWNSSYSLNALPTKNLVQWLWNAKITQQTGIDWDGIDLNISTAEPVFTLTPPEVQDWKIIQQPDFQPRRSMKMVAAPQPMLMEAAMDAAPKQLTRTEGQLFAIYNLGKVNITSGKEARIKIDAGTWPAAFTYLSRPLQTDQVFLQAKLDLSTEVVQLPSGTASIQVDSIHVGKRQFSLHEKNNIDISFGSDPAIVVDVQTNHRAGKEGLLTKKSTYEWNWDISFTNNKSIPIKLQIEDSYPHAGHSDIAITEQIYPPLPSKNSDGNLSWDVTLQPQGEQKLKFGYKVKYPKDMNVHLGR